MSARIYDPAAPADAISMTPAARDHVRRQLQRQGAQALLLGVTESGCNGYMYNLKFVTGDHQVPDARAFAFDDIRVLVAEDQWRLVRGTEIDYVTNGLNSAIMFRNPNATGQCGCGESFSVDAAP